MLSVVSKQYSKIHEQLEPSLLFGRKRQRSKQFQLFEYPDKTRSVQFGFLKRGKVYLPIKEIQVG
jgi:hypothetical protein